MHWNSRTYSINLLVVSLCPYTTSPHSVYVILKKIGKRLVGIKEEMRTSLLSHVCVDFPLTKKLPGQISDPGRLFIRPGDRAVRGCGTDHGLWELRQGGGKKVSQSRISHDSEPCDSKALQRTETCAPWENQHSQPHSGHWWSVSVSQRNSNNL